MINLRETPSLVTTPILPPLGPQDSDNQPIRTFALQRLRTPSPENLPISSFSPINKGAPSPSSVTKIQS